jgi:hypothetical protein
MQRKSKREILQYSNFHFLKVELQQPFSGGFQANSTLLDEESIPIGLPGSEGISMLSELASNISGNGVWWCESVKHTKIN